MRVNTRMPRLSQASGVGASLTSSPKAQWLALPRGLLHQIRRVQLLQHPNLFSLPSVLFYLLVPGGKDPESSSIFCDHMHAGTPSPLCPLPPSPCLVTAGSVAAQEPLACSQHLEAFEVSKLSPSLRPRRSCHSSAFPPWGSHGAAVAARSLSGTWKPFPLQPCWPLRLALRHPPAAPMLSPGTSPQSSPLCSWACCPLPFSCLRC